MKMHRLGLLLSCCLAVGCDDQKKTVEVSQGTELAPEKPEVDEVVPEPEPEPAKFFREVELNGSPFDDKQQVLYVKFTGISDTPTALRRSYSSDRIAGKFIAKPDAKLEIKQSMLVISEARPLKVKPESLRLPGTTFDDKKQRFGEDQVLEFKQGETIYMLKYAAEGTCFVGYNGVIYNLTCPTPVEFEGKDWDGSPTPLKYTWWILTSQGATRGWLEVDEKTFVHEVDKKATKRLRRKRKKKK